MNIIQRIWSPQGWKTTFDSGNFGVASLILIFGSRDLLTDAEKYYEIRREFPTADIVTCSSSGEICNSEVLDESIVINIIEFEKTNVVSTSVNLNNYINSFEAGKKLIEGLDKEDLAHILVFSDGNIVNGSSLVDGINSVTDNSVKVTGGLAGDGTNFEYTLVSLNGHTELGNVIGIGLYGKHLKTGVGVKGGWDSFGPERIVTKSNDNVLFELDGQSALSLYKKYLGEAAGELPASALYFPLSLIVQGQSEPIVRTILSINEEDQSMIFAGNIQEGSTVRLMMYNIDRLIDGAAGAGEMAKEDLIEPEFALLVSCVGRKLVLGQNIYDEIEIIKDKFCPETLISGFYSYGEIAPFAKSQKCELHNQTMTVTTFSEV